MSDGTIVVLTKEVAFQEGSSRAVRWKLLRSGMSTEAFAAAVVTAGLAEGKARGLLRLLIARRMIRIDPPSKEG